MDGNPDIELVRGWANFVDAAIGEGLVKVFEKEGARVLLHTLPDSVSHDGNRFILPSKAGEIHCDQLLVATVRQPNTDGLNLDQAGVDTGAHGAIMIDDLCFQKHSCCGFGYKKEESTMSCCCSHTASKKGHQNWQMVRRKP